MFPFAEIPTAPCDLNDILNIDACAYSGATAEDYNPLLVHDPFPIPVDTSLFDGAQDLVRDLEPGSLTVMAEEVDSVIFGDFLHL